MPMASLARRARCLSSAKLKKCRAHACRLRGGRKLTRGIDYEFDAGNARIAGAFMGREVMAFCVAGRLNIYRCVALGFDADGNKLYFRSGERYCFNVFDSFQ